MKNPAGLPLEAFPSIFKGQLRKIRDLQLAVTVVGKTLVPYKRDKQQSKGISIGLTSNLDLSKYLLSRKAVLVSG